MDPGEHPRSDPVSAATCADPVGQVAPSAEGAQARRPQHRRQGPAKAAQVEGYVPPTPEHRLAAHFGTGGGHAHRPAAADWEPPPPPPAAAALPVSLWHALPSSPPLSASVAIYPPPRGPSLPSILIPVHIPPPLFSSLSTGHRRQTQRTSGANDCPPDPRSGGASLSPPQGDPPPQKKMARGVGKKKKRGIRPAFPCLEPAAPPVPFNRSIPFLSALPVHTLSHEPCERDRTALVPSLQAVGS